MIKFRSALDSIQDHGIANDGPISQAGLQSQIKAKNYKAITESTPTKPKFNAPLKPLSKEETIQNVLDSVPNITTADKIDASIARVAARIKGQICDGIDGKERGDAVKGLHTQPKRSKPVTHKPVTHKDSVTHTGVTHKDPVTHKTQADRARDYRDAHADEIKEKNRLRMAAKRAKLLESR